MSFSIKTPVFEGPLDLLLSLIEKRKLLINDVSLASVADDYMAHLQNADEFPTHDVAHFVLIASTLVLIKSRSLLPEFALSDEEEADIKDLETRLKIYKKIQELAAELKGRFGTKVLFAPEKSPYFDRQVFAPHPSITPMSVRESVFSIISRFPKVEQLKKAVVEKIMSLEDMMGTLATRIQGALKMQFSEFAKTHKRGDASEREVKVNTIVSFLAMLELVKQGILLVEQRGQFADINMETETVATPNYSA
ncbi:MAG: segregation/condensation protein A [Candidatus Pacebacteria bacterium]|nr:segregation/condensation protein A [Candidatus Paceibacterota bacterium]